VARQQQSQSRSRGRGWEWNRSYRRGQFERRDLKLFVIFFCIRPLLFPPAEEPRETSLDDVGGSRSELASSFLASAGLVFIRKLLRLFDFVIFQMMISKEEFIGVCIGI
jgi:hypothetical protein